MVLMVINADEVCYSDGFIRLKMQEQLDDDDAIDASCDRLASHLDLAFVALRFFTSVSLGIVKYTSRLPA